MSLQVMQLSSEDDAELTGFLDSLSQESVSVLGYHYPFFRNMLEKLGIGRPMYLGLRRSGQLCGYLPAFLKNSPAGTVFSSLPFFGPNAGVLCAQRDQSEAHSALLEELLRIAKESAALSCSVYTPFLSKTFEPYESSFGQSVVVNKFTQYLELSHVNWSTYIQKNLRRAQKASVTVTSEVTPDRLSTFYEIYRQNCADFGIPLKPRECIELLASDAVRGRHSQFYFASMKGEIVAGLLVLFSPSTVSYYVPCSRADYRVHQPGTLLIDEAVKDAQRRGLKYWNWESSPSRDSGVYQFKKKWGSLEDEYRIYIKTFQSEGDIRRLGRTGLAELFPYYFVWPFDRL